MASTLVTNPQQEDLMAVRKELRQERLDNKLLKEKVMELIQSNESLISSVKELEELIAAVNDKMVSVAHEVRTPLVA